MDVYWGAFQANVACGHIKYGPENLKCDFAVRNPEAEIIEAGGDTAVVGEVIRRLARELGLQCHAATIAHAENLVAEQAREEAIQLNKTYSVEL